jgi:hypothetical protein
MIMISLKNNNKQVACIFLGILLIASGLSMSQALAKTDCELQPNAPICNVDSEQPPKPKPKPNPPPSPISNSNWLEELARDQLGVSILTVNLLDIMNYPHSPEGVHWQTRYTRIFTWMKDTKTFPDVIVLQETPGYWSCPTDARRLPDYAALDFLLDGIRDASGEQYRIAYLIAGKPGGVSGFAWIGKAPALFCSAQGGKALLYRPSRIRNVITNNNGGDPIISPYENPYPIHSTYLARSIQCCNPAADRTDVCSLIDGPMATPPPGHFESFIGTCPTPLGVAFTRSRKATQGEDRNKPFVDAIFSRLELVNQPGNFIHLYNVHRGWNQDWRDKFDKDPPPEPQVLDYGSQNINQLVTDIENRFQSSGQTLYPPILVGDFNVNMPSPEEVFPPIISYFPRFEVGVYNGLIDGVLLGKRSNFPSKQAAHANLGQYMPGDGLCEVPDKLWSDHCGVFFRVEPTPRK